MRKNPDVREREIAGETVLLNVENGRYFVLNQTGTLIWSHVGSLGPEDIVERLTSRFEVELKAAKSATEIFLEELASEGLTCT